MKAPRAKLCTALKAAAPYFLQCTALPIQTRTQTPELDEEMFAFNYECSSNSR